MARKTYTVVGAFPVQGSEGDHRPGSTFTDELEPEREEFMLATGQLQVGKGEKVEPPAKVPCPACVEQGLKQPPTFDDLGELQQHYADKHPALLAPDTLPAAADQKEE